MFSLALKWWVLPLRIVIILKERLGCQLILKKEFQLTMETLPELVDGLSVNMMEPSFISIL